MRFLALDGLRGVAALCVMLFHYGSAYSLTPFPRGYLAVDFFFLLSGFVIAHSYEDRLRSGLPVRRFAWARAVRLYPLAVASVLSVATLRLAYPPSSEPVTEVLRQTILNAALLPDLSARAEDQFPLVGPSWSLFYELWINLAYAAFLPWLTRRVLMAVVILAGIALVLAAQQAGTVELLHHNLATGTARVTFSFGLGVLAYRERQRIIDAFASAPRFLSYALVLLTFCVPHFMAGDWLIDLFSIMLVSPLAFVLALRPAVRDSGSLESRLGDLSYPVYLLHMPVAMYVGVGLGWATSGLTLSVIACVVTLVGSYYALLYDRRVRAWLNGLRSRSDGSATLTSPNVG